MGKNSKISFWNLAHAYTYKAENWRVGVLFDFEKDGDKSSTFRFFQESDLIPAHIINIPNVFIIQFCHQQYVKHIFHQYYFNRLNKLSKHWYLQSISDGSGIKAFMKKSSPSSQKISSKFTFSETFKMQNSYLKWENSSRKILPSMHEIFFVFIQEIYFVDNSRDQFWTWRTYPWKSII